MPSRHVARFEAEVYLVQLQGCFVAWNDAMTAIAHADRAERSVVTIIATIGPVYRAHRQLMQLTVTPPMQATHRAAVGLVQSAVDALDAIAVGRGSPAVRDLSEQLTIFQTELVRFAEQAGLVIPT